MNSLRRNWQSVADARLERALGRALRTLPMLRYRGGCLGCGAGLAQHHHVTCPVEILELKLLEHRNRISPKEVTHFLFRKTQAKTQAKAQCVS